MMNIQPLLDVKNLKKYYEVGKSGLGKKKRLLKAVDDVSFSIYPGEVLGVVGESGCGKSTTGRCVLRLHEPSDGELWFDGKDITKFPQKEMKQLRQKMQMVFQDPMSSFDPRYTIRQSLEEPFHIFRKSESKNIVTAQIEELMNTVGLSEKYLDRYPHEFSGGQRQRIGIARAISMNPQLLVCDEPVSALDVSIQSQVLNLFIDLQSRMNLTYLFISHDLSVVKFISNKICVMYLGKVVEYAEKDELFSHQLHPYTQVLISSIPAAHPSQRGQRMILKGDVPNPISPPKGCYFCDRCPHAMEKCKIEQPEFLEQSPGHFVACHLY